MRGKLTALPAHPVSGARESAIPALPVPAVTDFEYQPIRVLMSVLLSAAARMRIKTSPAAGRGTGASSRYSSCSVPPWPFSSTALMYPGTPLASCIAASRHGMQPGVEQIGIVEIGQL